MWFQPSFRYGRKCNLVSAWRHSSTALLSGPSQKRLRLCHMTAVMLSLYQAHVVTFPAAENYHPETRNKLYCSVTEARECQLPRVGKWSISDQKSKAWSFDCRCQVYCATTVPPHHANSTLHYGTKTSVRQSFTTMHYVNQRLTYLLSWCRQTAALEQVACFTAVIWQSLPIQKTVENVFVCQGLGCGA